MSLMMSNIPTSPKFLNLAWVLRQASGGPDRSCSLMLEIPSNYEWFVACNVSKVSVGNLYKNL